MRKRLVIAKWKRIVSVAFFVILCNCGSPGSSKTHFGDDTEEIPPESTVAEVDKVDTTLRVNENIAFGNINFGISRQQYENIIENEPKEIGLFNYSFRPHFTTLDQLYRLELISTEFNTWDTAIIKLNTLESKIFKFYPTCNFVNNNFGIYNAFNERIQISREWEVGRKIISTGIYTKEFDVNNMDHTKEYLTICTISNENYIDGVRIDKQKKLDSVVNKSQGRF